MTEPVPGENQGISRPPAPGPGTWPTMAAVVLCLSVVALGGAWLVALCAVRQPLRMHWSLQALLASAALISSSLVLFQQWRTWSRPLRKLHELIPKVRAGQEPIEQLSQVGGALGGLATLVQDLLHDLRQQHRAVSELNEEIRQRIAQRTDALERTIGSLRQQATRDPLTGLYNRRMLDQHLPQVVEQCLADKVPLCLLMIDVDHFKLLNDTLGHAAGDEMLRAVGQLIRSTIREEDIAFRCGGDEFVILLPGGDKPDGQMLADRLISLMDGLTKTLHVSEPPRLSIGMSTLVELESPSSPELLRAADKALYEIKSARRQGGMKFSRSLQDYAPVAAR